MACAHPFLLQHSRDYKRVGEYNIYNHFQAYEVPCGWCMSCRIDKRNAWQDRIEYCLNKEHSHVGAFVTLTYDDDHLVYNKFGVPTLEPRDVTNFIKRLRRYLDYHKMWSGAFHKDFKYFVVGEYGDQFKRPHYHILFLGLDFVGIRKLCYKCWPFGRIIKSLPILNGGIRYVLKYLDKQQHGEIARLEYDYKCLARPFHHASTSLGRNVFFRDMDRFLKRGTYVWRQKERPASQYYVKKFLIRQSIEQRMEGYNHWKSYVLKGDFSDVETARSYYRTAKERMLVSKARSDGMAVFDDDIFLMRKVSAMEKELDVC